MATSTATNSASSGTTGYYLIHEGVPDGQQSQHHHQQTTSHGVGNGTIEEGKNNLLNVSASNSDDRQDGNSSQLEPAGEEGESSVPKTPNSYKYPLLKRYYEFGPWIGRNRKAICLGCHLQTSSSQPDRLLKHLNRCNALSEEEKVAVRDLMNERTANKRKRPLQGRPRRNNDDSEYYDDEDGNDDGGVHLPSGSLKRSRRDGPVDRNSQIDEALTRFIMSCRIPLKAIHSPEFVEFCRVLNPDYHIPSRETITNVLIPGLLNII